MIRRVGGHNQLLRRARGFAPAPLPLPPGFEHSPDILALGAELKNTFCLLRDRQLVMSQHIGDLKDAVTLADFERCLTLFADLHQHRPAVIAIDQHPQYLSSCHGRQLARDAGLALTEIQHHHAHIAACLGDNGRALAAPPVLGVSLDGLGYARVDDRQQLWGGEIFVADYRRAQRLVSLKPVALPGGNRAMEQPWRNCVAQLHSALGWPQVMARYGHLEPLQTLASQPAQQMVAMIDSAMNCPLSSSCGRLFDAVAAAVGINARGSISYEGQAAMALETCITDADWAAARAYPFALCAIDVQGGRVEQGTAPRQIDPAPMWVALLDDIAAGQSIGMISARFHKGLVTVIADCLLQLADEHKVITVALSGGVFQNARLATALQSRLKEAGLEVLVHCRVPANDGGIALGQALIAAAQLGTHGFANRQRGEVLCV